MGTTNLGSAPPYTGRQDVSFTSVQEANNRKGAEGQSAPAGTTPVAVEAGDTISELMSQANPPMNWNNEADRAKFLQDNPQFADARGGRNPDLIWPGEVIYIRNSSSETTPPTNGTQAVSGPDANGNTTYQNYVNGQPSGSQYTARQAPNGQPANAVIIGENGGEIRTDAQGMPLTGWSQVGETAQNGENKYVYFVNGMPTTESQTRGMTEGPPTAAPTPRTGNDFAGQSYSNDGWHAVGGSSQGVSQYYFVDGYQIDSDQVINGRADGPPPIIPPGTNAGLGRD